MVDEIHTGSKPSVVTKWTLVSSFGPKCFNTMLIFEMAIQSSLSCITGFTMGTWKLSSLSVCIYTMPQNLDGRTGKPTWVLEPVVLVISFIGRCTDHRGT